MQRPPDCQIIFACREMSIEHWQLRGRLALTIDDFARGIAAQAPTLAMAHVTPSVIELAGVTRRCYRMVVERAGRVGQLVLPLHFQDGKISGRELKYRDEGPVPAAGYWIGVAPEREVTLMAPGPVAGRGLPEG